MTRQQIGYALVPCGLLAYIGIAYSAGWLSPERTLVALLAFAMGYIGYACGYYDGKCAP